jgi:hypothetical protein
MLSDCTLEYYEDVCETGFNEEIIEFIIKAMISDKRYKPSKKVHKTRQAGVYHVGKTFRYRKEYFGECDIPPLLLKLRTIAQTITKEEFDIILFKVYQPGESLANHQDVDGRNMNVACFTFATSQDQLCKLAWYKYNGTRNKEGKPIYSYNNPVKCFTPAICSMWFMSGSTNSKYSHRVIPSHAANNGLRVSVSFRQSIM